MNTTFKALMVGTLITAAALSVMAAATPAAPVYKLDAVVVTAQRLPANDVIKLATVEVTASRAELLAAQTEENTKQAAIASNPRI
jgi:Flp pilus assembly protein CpaB